MFGGVEEGGGEPHGAIEMTVDEDVEALAGNLLNQLAKENETEVAVEVFGFGEQGSVDNLFENAGQGVVGRGSGFPIAVEGFEPGDVAHHLEDSDFFFVGMFQIGEVAAEGVVESDFAGFDEFHHREGGGGHFGDRGHVVDSVHRDGWSVGVVGEMAVGLAEKYAAVLQSHHLAARIGFLLDAVEHDAVYAAEGGKVKGADNGVATQAVVPVGDTPKVGLEVGAAMIVFAAEDASATHIDELLKVVVLFGGLADGVDGGGDIRREQEDVASGQEGGEGFLSVFEVFGDAFHVQAVGDDHAGEVQFVA